MHSKSSWSHLEQVTIIVACMGLFVSQLDMTVVNLALSAIRHNLGISNAASVWIVDAYLAPFAASIMGFGYLGDLIGRAAVFRWAMAIFTLSSIGDSIAPGLGVLIAFRSIQGLAAAAVVVSSLAIILQRFTDYRRGKIIGIWTAVAGLSLVTGPPLGGLLVNSWGWRSVFWINVPIGIITLAAATQLGHDRDVHTTTKIDWAGQIGLVVALASFSLGLSLAFRSSMLGLGGRLLLGISIIVTLLLIRFENQLAFPIIPVSLFRSATFRGASAASLLVNFSTLGLLYVLSFQLEKDEHFSALSAGIRIIPLFASYVLASAFSGYFTSRLGARLNITLGLALSGTFVVIISQLGQNYNVASLTLIIIGTGVGIGLPALVSAAVRDFPPEKAGVASGANNAARQIGGTIGVALIGGILASAKSSQSGIHISFLVIAAGYLLASISGFLALGAKKQGVSQRLGSILAKDSNS